MLAFSSATRRSWRLAAALFLACGTATAASLATLGCRLPHPLGAPTVGIGLLLSLTWLGLGIGLAALALPPPGGR